MDNTKKILEWFGKIVHELPIGGYGVKVYHDAVLEVEKFTSTNTGSPQFTAKQLHRAAKDAGLHSADIIDLIEVIGKQQASA